MIKLVKSEARGITKLDWLESKHSFSFSNYYDSENVNFGPLRVLNDDLVVPGGGFPKHSHSNMEIVTIVLDGCLIHEDSTGKQETISSNNIQRMTAGSGIIHSEFNGSEDLAVRFLQLWFFPDKKNLPPSYEMNSFKDADLENQLLQIVSGNKNDECIFINQDVNVYLSKMDKNSAIEHTLTKSRGIYIYLINGSMKINDLEIQTGDGIKIKSEVIMLLKAHTKSFFILFDLPMNNY